MTNKETLDRLLSAFPPHALTYFASIESSTELRTRINYAYDLMAFFRAHASDLQALQAVTTQQLNEYINSYPGEQSRARNLATLRGFFGYLCRTKRVRGNPAMDIEAPKLHEKPIVRLDQREAGKMISAARYSKGMSDRELVYADKTKARDTAILTLFLQTGIRVSELVSLNLSDFDFEKRTFIVTRKGGNRVRLYFSEECSRTLLDYIKSDGITGNMPLFMSLQHRRLCVRSVEMLVKKYASIVTDKKITPHKLRSTYGTLLYEATGDIGLVADVLGHKDVNTTKKHYADISDERRKSAAEKVKLKGGD